MQHRTVRRPEHLGETCRWDGPSRAAAREDDPVVRDEEVDSGGACPLDIHVHQQLRAFATDSPILDEKMDVMAAHGAQTLRENLPHVLEVRAVHDERWQVTGFCRARHLLAVDRRGAVALIGPDLWAMGTGSHHEALLLAFTELERNDALHVAKFNIDLRKRRQSKQIGDGDEAVRTQMQAQGGCAVPQDLCH